MRFRPLIMACTFLFLGTSFPALADSGPIANTNMPGRDYKDFELHEGPDYCQKACMKDEKCEAWTWVKQGLQGKLRHCWLKNAVPRRVSDPCCVSGTRSAPID
ncbi:MAG: PAN domain-containing protein [Xanthobacteraceae bacterium]